MTMGAGGGYGRRAGTKLKVMFVADVQKPVGIGPVVTCVNSRILRGAEPRKAPVQEGISIRQSIGPFAGISNRRNRALLLGIWL